MLSGTRIVNMEVLNLHCQAGEINFVLFFNAKIGQGINC